MKIKNKKLYTVYTVITIYNYIFFSFQQLSLFSFVSILSQMSLQGQEWLIFYAIIFVVIVLNFTKLQNHSFLF